MDRAALLGNDPARARFSGTDAVLQLTAEDVRNARVTSVIAEEGKKKTEKTSSADVIPDPRPDDEPPRPAHALIKLVPHAETSNSLKKLYSYLARKSVWALQPSECN